ncbi:hypothetical protein [Nocardia thailandica]
MARDHEPPLRELDEDIALRPVHRPPRIRGEAAPRPVGGQARVSEDILDLDRSRPRREGRDGRAEPAPTRGATEPGGPLPGRGDAPRRDPADRPDPARGRAEDRRCGADSRAGAGGRRETDTRDPDGRREPTARGAAAPEPDAGRAGAGRAADAAGAGHGATGRRGAADGDARVARTADTGRRGAAGRDTERAGGEGDGDRPADPGRRGNGGREAGAGPTAEAGRRGVGRDVAARDADAGRRGGLGRDAAGRITGDPGARGATPRREAGDGETGAGYGGTRSGRADSGAARAARGEPGGTQAESGRGERRGAVRGGPTEPGVRRGSGERRGPARPGDEPGGRGAPSRAAGAESGGRPRRQANPRRGADRPAMGAPDHLHRGPGSRPLPDTEKIEKVRQRRPAPVDRPDDTADRAMGTGRSARKPTGQRKQTGPSLLDDVTRARYETIVREQSGLRAVWATFRLHTDDLRRRNAQARDEAVVVDGFDRSTAELTDRGYAGAGGGKMNVVGRPVEYRATTAQVAGLWPWSVGAGAPLIGTPLGSHLHTGAPVCFDPMNWFMRGSFITAPSLFVLGLNGFGKSSLVRRIVLGGVAQGITPLVLADVKPDYRKLVELVGGQVIDLGYGHGKLNPLAAGVLGSIVPRLDAFPALQQQVLQDLRARQVTLIAGLVELVRGARVADYEETLIATALRILYRPGSGFTPDRPPIMEDLLEVIVAGGPEMNLDAGADDDEEYQLAIKHLRRSLRALTQGPFGAVFNGQTSVPIDTTAVAVCIDVSHIPSGDKKLKAAVMLACWADGFASVEAAHVLTDAKMGPQRYFQVVMDELWQVLGLGDFMVDRVDELTRLQRGMATALIMISHTIKDLQALGSEAAIAKAVGFLERARAKIFGALPAEEIARLDSTVPFTAAEAEMVTGWSAPQALTGEALRPGQQRPAPPGTGRFLLKIGEDRRPGIPFHMEFTVSERESGIHDTNQRFSEFGDNPRGGADPAVDPEAS